MTAPPRIPGASAFWDGTTAQATQLALADAHFGALRRLALTAERESDGAVGHPDRVGTIALAIARRLGLDPFAATWLGHAAPLHDIGKLAVPDAILSKPAKLSAAEFEIVKDHTRVGAAMLSGTGSRLLGLASEIALTHHERYDGSGYPDGRLGDEIPLSGRIVAIADVFDALTHARPYKHAWPIEQALAEIRHQRGAHFDPEVADAFMAIVGEIPLARPELAVVR